MFKPKITIPPLPDVDFIKNFLSASEADFYFITLCNELSFVSETYVFNEQTIETKRKMSYHSEHAYSYSKQVYNGKPWTPTLLKLREIILNKTSFEFNAVLCNFYENGEAGMGWHADKEKELGTNPTIASISFGETRTFAFRHRRDIINEKNPKIISEYDLNSGDLLIMKGNTQAYFEHSLIKNKSAKNPRLNLTFRKIIT